MRERVLVSGAGGFLGRDLCIRLAESNEVIGVDLPHVEPVRAVEWNTVTDASGLARAIGEARPTTVVHAAFRNRKPAEWGEAQYISEALSDNTAVFAAATSAKARVLLVSSSAVYGNAMGAEVIDESAPMQPVSAYGRAKKAVEETARKFAANGMPLCIARLFNLIGPREQPGMILSDWVRQAMAVRMGAAESVVIRHRRTARDFVDVRDVARALSMLVYPFREGEVFNVASGGAVSLMEVSMELDRLAGEKLSFVETTRVLDPNDVVSQRGSSEKLRVATGWEPLIPWRRSLADLWSTLTGTQNAAAGC